jgi:uncharacterized protein YjhX (UPF0386 family)
MSIIASCGHILTQEEKLGNIIAVKDYCRDGNKAVKHLTVCNECFKYYQENKLELKTKREQEQWLNSL